MTDILKAIIDNGLSVRQIPLTSTETYSCRDDSNTEGWEVYRFHADLDYFNGSTAGLKRFNKDYPDGKKMKTKTFNNVDGGRWMCKKPSHTDSMVRWNKKTDCLSDTLEQSVIDWIENNKL